MCNNLTNMTKFLQLYVFFLMFALYRYKVLYKYEPQALQIYFSAFLLIY
jgi:hypothetical protein